MSFTHDPLRELAEFVAQLEYAALPPSVRERAKLQIADSVGVTLAGSAEPEATEYARRLPSQGGVSMLRSGFPSTRTEDAGAANAVAMGFLELDEGCVPAGHPALHVLAPLLAQAQADHLSGEDLITAFVAAYDVQARIQAATSFRYEVHPHGHIGSVAAAAGLAKLIGGDADAVRTAMYVAAGMMPATLWTQCLDGATVRNAFAAQACRNAFFALSLARAGFTGSPSAIAEVFTAILGTGFDADAVARDLGRDFAIERSYIKLHSCCGLVHPVIDALLAAFGAVRRADAYPPWTAPRLPPPDAVQKVTIRVAERALRLDVPAQPLPLSARFSIPYAVAAFFHRGEATPDAFSLERVQDPRLRAFASRITVVADDALTKLAPKHNAAEVELTLSDGRRLSGKCIDALGTPWNPVTAAEVEAKFRALAAVAAVDAGTLWGRLLTLDRVADCASLFTLDPAMPGESRSQSGPHAIVSTG